VGLLSRLVALRQQGRSDSAAWPLPPDGASQP